MYKKTRGIIGLKKLRSIASILLAICLTAVMFTGVTVPVQATSSPDGKMLEVYNQNPTWAYGEVFGQQVNLGSGDYVLSAYYKHEGGWIMQAGVWDGSAWVQAPGATVTESDDEYLTTIEFTLTETQNVWVRFLAPQNTNKMWLANVSLCNAGDTSNLLENGDFTVGAGGLDGWTGSNSSFNNKYTKDIEDGFFDKNTIESPSGNMMQVYNESGWSGQLLYRQINQLPAGTYKLSAYYKHEGGWSLQVLQSDSQNGSYTEVPGATFTESEEKYYTTIVFTLTATSYIRAQFNAPANTNKMWLANLSLRHISGGTGIYIGKCANEYGNGDFTVTRVGLPEGLAFWQFTNLNTAFPDAQAMEIEDGFFDKNTIESPSGNMMQVYNLNGWGDQIVYRPVTLNAGTYKLSAYYKHDGGWSMQAVVQNGSWIAVPGATVTESEDKYYTTITFTLTEQKTIRAKFTAPTNTNKLWLANLTLRHISGGSGSDVGRCSNYFGNSDFTLTADANYPGLAYWTFDQSAQFNRQTMEIEDGFFEKNTIAPPSGNMMEVYNESGSTSHFFYRRSAQIPAGKYKLSIYFKHEGGWKMRFFHSTTMAGTYTELSGATVTESEDKYYTTVTFTLTASTNFIQVRFIPPTSTSKLWLANLTLRHISGGSYIGKCGTEYGNGDFTVTRDGLPANLAFLLFSSNWNSSGTTESYTAAFANAHAAAIEEGFFDKDAGTEPSSGKMLEVYNQNPGYDYGESLSWSQINLGPGTHKLSAYYKHEGGWKMQAAVWSDSSSAWVQAPGAIITESNDEYFTTIEFTLAKATNVWVRFVAPRSTSKLWLANVSLRDSGATGTSNLITNGDFTVGDGGLQGWTGTNTSFNNKYTKDIEDGFFKKTMGLESPTGKMLTATKAAGHVNLGFAQYINSLPAGTYELSAYIRQVGGWTFDIQSWQTDAWKSIPGSVSEKPDGWHFESITFTLNEVTNVRVMLTAPEDGGSVWISNVKLRRTDNNEIGYCKEYVNNGYFLNGTTGWQEDDYEDKITDIDTVDIPEDWFFIVLSNQELFDCIKLILCKQATQLEYPDSDIDRSGTTDIVDLLLIEQRMLAGASAAADTKRAAIKNSANGLDYTATVKYVSEKNGNDSTGNGTQANPYKTIGKANTGTNVTILLERGGTYRLTSQLNLQSGFRYGAYGTGDKPVVSASPKDYGLSSGDWTLYSGNIWQTSYNYADAGVVVFNDGESYGCKKFGDGAMAQLLTEGDYYHNGSTLYMYCSQNPATKYDSIEIGCGIVLFNIPAASPRRSNIYIDNISFKYAGKFGVRAQKVNGLYIWNCEFSWIGGSLQTDGKRFGNAIELWNGYQQDIGIHNNWFYQIYDAGFTFQGDSTTSTEKVYKNISCTDNLFENNNTSFEFWHSCDGFTFDNIQFNNNISRLAGFGHCEQRDDAWVAGHIYAEHRSGTVKTFTIQNNIFDTSKMYMAWMWFRTGGIRSDVWNVYGISGNTYYHKRADNSKAIYVGGYTYATSQAQLEEAVALFEASPRKVVWLGFDS